MLDKAKLVEEVLCQGENDYKTGGVFCSLFLAQKIKYCLTRGKFGFVQENENCKGFTDRKTPLDRSQCFKMIDGKKASAMLARSWKTPFNIGVIIPTKMRFCNERNDLKCVKNQIIKLTKIKNSTLN